MLNKRLHIEFEKGLTEPLYFIWSEESLFLEQVLAKALEVVITSSSKDFNYDVFYSSDTAQNILNVAETLPVMSPRRLVVLKDFHRFSSSNIKAMVPYLKNPCKSTCMIILSSKEPKHKLDINWQIYPLKIRENDIPAWLRQKVSGKGIKITENGIDYLIDLVGPDIGLLNIEIEKLALSGLKVIDSKDIASFTGMMREYTSFDLVDAIIAGQGSKR